MKNADEVQVPLGFMPAYKQVFSSAILWCIKNLLIISEINANVFKRDSTRWALALCGLSVFKISESNKKKEIKKW